ncbi:Pyrimidine 5'-nucleotidase YjjG [Colletotrichum sidae]|uniref:Pyrimidine 5'-nucleotidase YjjG n=1 Tax=Colletotrichum sidae TaxID=1347389 RepID=A0A4R8T6J6_9PEZI|nr:Pyrimidine 5'-nucleotidase YjjG [Colletotrichum sidae]
MDEAKRKLVRETLAAKSWFGFDLDDTLHEFRRASSGATSQTLEVVYQRYETATADLKDAYAEILRDKTLNAFSDGKTSFEYRRDRFAALLERFSLPQDADFLSELLAIYEEALARSLLLKDGALSLLSTLRRVGKKIAVVTEGPQDAQERTVEQLGLAEYVDVLATTNFFRVSKVDGLFPKVLEHLQISAADMVFIGDSSSRDMIPAGEANILCILYAEEAESLWKTQPPQVNSLREIEALVS